MTAETQIRLRPDGSIDTAHYMARGRRMRAEQAHALAGAGARRTVRPLALLAALAGLVFAARGQA